eukprot:Skav206422  [mRNA]  locus=scaffold292:398250:412008:+ [translate_table: standard]
MSGRSSSTSPKFRGFDDVRKEIEAETLRVCGAHRVSDEPILLRIFSPTVPTAEQPKDMPQKIRDLVKKHVARSSAIVLAVSAANSDLATSDALALAREVGVLTKFDLDDAGNSIAALMGDVYPLRLGYTAVVCRRPSFSDGPGNRSETASQAGVTYEQALKARSFEFAAGGVARFAKQHATLGRSMSRGAILDFDAFTGLSDMDIRVAMRNAAGPKPHPVRRATCAYPEAVRARDGLRTDGEATDPEVGRAGLAAAQPCRCVSMVFEELKQLAAAPCESTGEDPVGDPPGDPQLLAAHQLDGALVELYQGCPSRRSP